MSLTSRLRPRRDRRRRRRRDPCSARTSRSAQNSARGDRRSPCTPTARPRRITRTQERLDRRRRRLGLRHRRRRTRPCPRKRPERQHPRLGHGGLSEYRRAGVEGHATRRRRQVCRRRQRDGQEGSRPRSNVVRRRLCRQGRPRRQRGANRQGVPGSRRVARRLVDHRLQHLHRQRLRHEPVDDTAEARCSGRPLAALSIPPGDGVATQPFQLDSAAPTVPYRELAHSEARFSMLERSDPERAAQLLGTAQDDVTARWRYYEQLAGVERSAPAHTPPANIADTEDDT